MAHQHNVWLISVLTWRSPGGVGATNVFCAKAKRQQQMFSVRKRSGKMLVTEVLAQDRMLLAFVPICTARSHL
ncbi:hypothetical protein [Lysinibacillus sp. NPDC056232]|uniref:hypothetical protein n=1 Tax=Lysinibacillus sp. NPDC056232 TaxID=3345756 RepID=UPI0035E2E50F